MAAPAARAARKAAGNFRTSAILPDRRTTGARHHTAMAVVRFQSCACSQHVAARSSNRRFACGPYVRNRLSARSTPFHWRARGQPLPRSATAAHSPLAAAAHSPCGTAQSQSAAADVASLRTEFTHQLPSFRSCFRPSCCRRYHGATRRRPPAQRHGVARARSCPAARQLTRAQSEWAFTGWALADSTRRY